MKAVYMRDFLRRQTVVCKTADFPIKCLQSKSARLLFRALLLFLRKT